MAKDDIYKNETTYKHLLLAIPNIYSSSSSLLTTTYYTLLQDENIVVSSVVSSDLPTTKKRKYHIANPENILHFAKLAVKFKGLDLSYIRRLRYMRTLIAIAAQTDKNFQEMTRDDVDIVCAKLADVYKSPESKKDLRLTLKYVWRLLFPDKDEKGREDERTVPYVVRHLSYKINNASHSRKDDNLTYDEIERIVAYFEADKRMQAYLMLAIESLGRPQEILFRKLSEVKLQEGYAKILILDHSKTGLNVNGRDPYLQSIDSYPYLLEWLKIHPQKDNPNAWLFCNIAKNKNCEQLTPPNINKMLRIALKHLGLRKNCTCYTLKRIGVTFRRQRGESDMDIQHAARWSSTAQIKTYDKSKADDAMNRALARRGLIDDKKYEQLLPKKKKCEFCQHDNMWHSTMCSNCKRPIGDRVASFKTENVTMAAMQKNIELLQKELLSMKKLLAVEKIQKNV